MHCKEKEKIVVACLNAMSRFLSSTYYINGMGTFLSVVEARCHDDHRNYKPPLREILLLLSFFFFYFLEGSLIEGNDK